MQQTELRICYLSLRKWCFDLFRQACYLIFEPVNNFSSKTLQIKDLKAIATPRKWSLCILYYNGKCWGYALLVDIQSQESKASQGKLQQKHHMVLVLTPERFMSVLSIAFVSIQ